MARRKAEKPRYMPYPKEQGLRVGIKVSWYYYDDEADAKKAAKAAQHNAVIQAEQGYDFGYMMPGAIRKMPPNVAENAGRWEVCIP